MFSKNLKKKNNLVLGFIILVAIIGMYFLGASDFGEKETPAKKTYLIIGIITYALGLGGMWFYFWKSIIKEEKLPSEFRERDEREKQITAKATRKIYIIFQNLLVQVGFFFIIVISAKKIVLPGILFGLIFIGIFIFNNILFLIFTRKKYDPIPLNPVPPEDYKT